MRTAAVAGFRGDRWRARSLTGAFSDADVEAAFAAHRLATTGRTLGAAAFGAAVLWLVFIPTDRALDLTTPVWLAVAGLRLATAGALAAVGAVLRFAPRTLVGRWGRRGVAAVAVGSGGSFLAICALRPVAVENLHLSVVLYGTALLLFAPLALRTRAVLCAAMYAGFVAVAASRFPADDVDVARLVLSLAGAWAGAALSAGHLDRSARTAYALLRREEAATADLARLAAEDGLTGLANRRAFLDAAAVLAGAADLSSAPLTVVLLDLDGFKAINDTHGHAAGDAALRRVADLVRGALREGDVAGRLGGEEFALLLPGATEDDAVGIAERVRVAIETAAVELDGASVTVTASVGIARRLPGEPVDGVLRRADDAMYGAKRAGGNRLTLAA